MPASPGEFDPLSISTRLSGKLAANSRAGNRPAIVSSPSQAKLRDEPKAGHKLLSTAAWLAKAREKRKSLCRSGVHPENLGYVYFLG